MHVPVNEKNPTGMTIRDRHLRRLNGSYLDPSLIETIFKNYDKKGIRYPQKKKLNMNPPLEPDVVKALIASESDFREDPKNPQATAEEIILEYKGLLKSKSDYKQKAVEKFRGEYGKLTKK
ncbi:MAG: hypothetical protein A4S09_01335 [Proteobacteria bacterium SG_bin7]|nr:MAG: hypothetical protein A4S09_01335 [Proteobacteria bacterium SG_bin7]